MKLANRYSRVNFFTSLVVLLISGIAYYLVIHFILTKDLDKDLIVEEEEIEEYVKLYKALPPAGNFRNQIVIYSPEKKIVTREFVDTAYTQHGEHDEEPSRSLIFSVWVNNNFYKIQIIKSKVESEDLIRIIFLITLGITFLLLISLAIVNKLLLNRLWKPFHGTLAQLRKFNIADEHQIQEEKTSIDEFAELNKAAISLTSRVKKDYTDLKIFTDNASHEMMTPLAIINLKLDSLLQTGSFTHSQGELLEDIYSGVNRLSRLNQSLLLIAKIENNLIQDASIVSLKDLILKKAQQFQELIQAENLVIGLELLEKEVVISTYLADILLNNLIGNAIRHNIPNGNINIRLNNVSLTVSNTGKSEQLNSEKFFERFNKDSGSEGMGLGLSISKQICNYYSYQLMYKYLNGIHSFTVMF